MPSRTPTFWWDFRGSNQIIVESSLDKYPVLGIFSYQDGDAEKCLDKVNDFISDLDAGRICPKDAVKDLNK